MIKAKHNPLVYGFFKLYARLKIKRHFQDVVISGEVNTKEKALLLISNHISWWDGFWALDLNRLLFRKKFHFMMDESALKERWLFAYTGGFSISHRKKSMIESIQYTSDLLLDAENMVLIYPQGKLYSSHSRDIIFKKGIERIQFDEKNPAQVFFLVQLTDYFQFEKPTLYLYLGEADDDIYIKKNYEEQYREFYNQCLKKHSQIIV